MEIADGYRRAVLGTEGGRSQTGAHTHTHRHRHTDTDTDTHTHTHSTGHKHQTALLVSLSKKERDDSLAG